MNTRISKNFTLEELTDSETGKEKGIPNHPTTDAVCALCALTHHVLQPLRTAMQEPISISSGYRSPLLNKAVGGSTGSQHLKGEAADLNIWGDLAKGRRWFAWIRSHCDYDQLIWEHDAKGVYWVHVSYRADGKNRKQVIESLLKK